MRFQVSRQYQRGGESHFARFSDRTDAELFIQSKVESDKQLKLNVTYRLYDGTRLLETYVDLPVDGFSGPAGESSSSGRGSGATFRPTPFNAAPRPSGVPHNWLKDEDKKSDEK